MSMQNSRHSHLSPQFVWVQTKIFQCTDNTLKQDGINYFLVIPYK